MTTAEQSYVQHDHEALAVIFALRKCHKYIYGRAITIYTYSMPVKLIFSDRSIPSTASPRMQRWCLYADMYDLKFEYTKEVELADFLSRNPLSDVTGDGDLSSTYLASIENSFLLPNQVKDSISKDQFYQQLIRWIKKKSGQIMYQENIKELS